MYAVKGLEANTSWITAVTKDSTSAESFMKSIKASKGVSFSIQYIITNDFPFIIMESCYETSNSIRFLSPRIASDKIRKIYRDKGNYIFYAVVEPFTFNPPGKNAMSSLYKLEADTQDKKQRLSDSFKGFDF